MRKSILDKRRNEGWSITIWCTRQSVVCQITTPDEFDNASPVVDVSFSDFESAVKFARAVCRRTQHAVDAAGGGVENWFQMSGDVFLALLAEQPHAGNANR